MERRANPVQMVQAALRRNRRAIVNPFAGQRMEYGTGDPNAFPVDNVYSESMIFDGSGRADLAVNLPAMGLGASAVISQAAGVPQGFQNNDKFIVSKIPGFSSGQVLNANPKRIALTIQNQDAALDLYFALGTDAVSAGSFTGILLPAGIGYTFDNNCVPSDAVYWAWDGGTGVGVVMEGTRA